MKPSIKSNTTSLLANRLQKDISLQANSDTKDPVVTYPLQKRLLTIKIIVITSFFSIFSSAVSFANTITKVDPKDYANKVNELNAACKEKNSPSWNGFCVSRSYGPFSYADTGQTSMQLGLETASLELVYRSCEHSDFSQLDSLTAKAKTIFETQKFLDEIKPQDEALRNHVGRFFPCKSKSENDATIVNRLQWFDFMVKKYAPTATNTETRDTSRSSISSVDSAVDARQSRTTSVAPIAVWVVKQLSCNGFVAQELTRSPDATEIGRTGIVKIPNSQMEFHTPDIPELPIKAIRLTFDDRGRGVVDHYILLAQSDMGNPLAALMVTELPASIDTPQKALSAALAGERGNLQGTTAQPTLERINTPWGDGLDLYIPNRIGSPCFPAARFKLTSDSETQPTIGLSRFVTLPGRLIQFAITLPVTPGSTLEMQKANARRVMDVYAAGLRVR